MVSHSAPLVSVIVPCYNAAAYLEATVQSLRSQSLSTWECILVDDGSTDETAQVIQKLCLDEPRVRAAHQLNAGRAEACNLGLKTASPGSTYLFFLDSDDMLAPDALEVMTGYLEEHPRVGLLGCQFQEIDSQDKPIAAGFRSRFVPGRFLPRMLSDEERETPFVTFFCATGQGPFALFRRSVFAQTKGFEPALSRYSAHEDTDIFCQMALKAPVHYLPNRLYLKRIHEGQITSQIGRIQDAYSVFREKWDHLAGATPEEGRLLAEARHHYYRRHEPCRSLKVAAKSLQELFRRPRWHSLQWTASLLAEAFAGFSGLSGRARRHS